MTNRERRKLARRKTKKTGRKKFATTKKMIIIMLALTALVYGGTFLRQLRVQNLGGQTTATVTNRRSGRSSTRYDVVYRVNGVRHTGSASVGVWHNVHTVGSHLPRMVTIYYSTRNPGTFALSKYVPIWIPIINFSFVLLGVAIDIREAWKKPDRNASLILYGKHIDAKITKIMPMKDVKINSGKEFYRIFCIWTDPDTNKEYTFKNTDILLHDPAPLVSKDAVETLPVFVHPRNYAKYHMETDQFATDLQKFYEIYERE